MPINRHRIHQKKICNEKIITQKKNATQKLSQELGKSKIPANEISQVKLYPSIHSLRIKYHFPLF